MTRNRLPSLYAIRAFEAAARHLSMTRAAEELAVTPGAISRHIRSLEEQIDQILLLRNPTGLILTPAGEALASATRDGLDRIADVASGLKLRRLRRLSIGTYGYFASKILLPNWHLLQGNTPDLALDLHTSLSPLDLSPVHYDAVIAVSDGMPRPGLIIHRLVPIATLPVCSPRLLKQGQLDFATVPLLHTRPRPEDWGRWLEYAEISGVPSPNTGSSFESLALTIEAATAGLGAAIAIEALIQGPLERNELIAGHHIVRSTRRHFSLIYDARFAADPALLHFQDWLLSITENTRAQSKHSE